MMQQEARPAQLVEAALSELVSAICLEEREEYEALLVELQGASTEGVGLQEIVGLQLMQKIGFVEAHLQGNEWMAGAVRQKKEELQAIWRRGIREHARIRNKYEH